MEGKSKKEEEYACAEGGAHLPVAHALCIPKPEIIFGAGIFWGAGDCFVEGNNN